MTEQDQDFEPAGWDARNARRLFLIHQRGGNCPPLTPAEAAELAELQRTVVAHYHAKHSQPKEFAVDLTGPEADWLCLSRHHWEPFDLDELPAKLERCSECGILRSRPAPRPTVAIAGNESYPFPVPEE